MEHIAKKIEKFHPIKTDDFEIPLLKYTLKKSQ